MVALAVDRLVLGGESGPASASAAELLAVDGAVPELLAPCADGKLGLPTTEPVAKQLASLGNVPSVTDAFAPPERWMTEIRRMSAEASANANSSPGDELIAKDPVVASFMERHTLTAVLSESGKPDRALVKVKAHSNQPERTKLLRVGDVLDGFTLLHLHVKNDKLTADANKGAGNNAASATFSDPSGSADAVTLAIAAPGEKGE